MTTHALALGGPLHGQTWAVPPSGAVLAPPARQEVTYTRVVGELEELPPPLLYRPQKFAAVHLEGPTLEEGFRVEWYYLLPKGDLHAGAMLEAEHHWRAVLFVAAMTRYPWLAHRPWLDALGLPEAHAWVGSTVWVHRLEVHPLLARLRAEAEG